MRFRFREAVGARLPDDDYVARSAAAAAIDDDEIF
jgi:hypothetical protein